MSHQKMVFLTILIGILSSSGSSSGDYFDEDEIKDKLLIGNMTHNEQFTQHLFILKSKPIKVEVVAVLPDFSNESLNLAKALNKALNMATAHLEFDSASIVPGRNISWRVRTYILSGSGTGTSNRDLYNVEYQDDEPAEAPVAEALRGNRPRKKKPGNLPKNTPLGPPANTHLFNPRSMVGFCDFLERNRPLAIVNLIGDAASERMVQMLSTFTALPLIGSTELFNKEAENDYYINLSTSVQDLAAALGLLLIYCHWHTFAVIFDDSQSLLSSHLVWEEGLSGARWSSELSQVNRSLTDLTDYEDEWSDKSSERPDLPYSSSSSSSEGYTSSPHPTLHPHYIHIRKKRSNSAFRALSQIAKGNQGVVVLLCSQTSLIQVFRSAHLLRMLSGDYVFILVGHYSQFETIPDWVPTGVLALRAPRHALFSKKTMKSIGKLLGSAFSGVKNLRLPPDEENKDGERRKSFPNGGGGGRSQFPRMTTSLSDETTVIDSLESFPNVSCWTEKPHFGRKFVSVSLVREIRKQMELFSTSSAGSELFRSGISTEFDILNLVGSSDDLFGSSKRTRHWQVVGNVSLDSPQVKLDTIRWPGGGISGPSGRNYKAYRIVSIISPPFVMEGYAEENKTCVKGLPCLRVKTTDKDELALIFADFERKGKGDSRFEVICCDGLSIDLLSSVARELKFEVDLFIVPDGYYGEKIGSNNWNGLMASLISGAAQMTFAPFSVTSQRATAIDFSTPYFFSGVGMIGISRNRGAPLFAFLSPFSPELWVAIIIALNITAVVVATYEWISPFGLNPWGRQRTKNFSMASALWVVWGRLFSHLVAFKAPKSWPNKFLINVWGGFSVIFVASYTANIAALFAGMFFERSVDVNDRTLLSQRVSTIKYTATDFYIKKESYQLWEHVQKHQAHNFNDAIRMLKTGELDIVVGDSPLLDYFRGTDPDCSLVDVSDHDKIGDDTYAVGMSKGFPLKDSISAVISKFIQNGYMDYLHFKWFGQMQCFRLRNPSQKYYYGARALGVEAVTGMLIVLGLGMLLGLLILILELIVYKYILPHARSQPKGTLWRSPNLMFFSQKLYRFINCVELVSPHHAAKELVSTLKKGQITSLFQKSVKRKEAETKRRRKSKQQFYTMIQEIRRVQKAGGVIGDNSDPSEDGQEKIVMEKQGVYTIQGGGRGMHTSPYFRPQRQGYPGPGQVGEGSGSHTQQMLMSRGGWTSRSAGHLERFGGQEDLSAELIRGAAGRTPMMRRPGGGGGVCQGHPFPGHPQLPGPGSSDFSRSNSGSRRFSRHSSYGGGSSDEDEVMTIRSERSVELEALSKGQLIEMWRKSELELKRKLADACRVNKDLTKRINLLKNEDYQPP